MLWNFKPDVTFCLSWNHWCDEISGFRLFIFVLCGVPSKFLTLIQDKLPSRNLWWAINCDKFQSLITSLKKKKEKKESMMYLRVLSQRCPKYPGSQTHVSLKEHLPYSPQLGKPQKPDIKFWGLHISHS